MSETENLLPEPHLSSDFAVRVLRRADVLVARRRRVRRAIAGTVAGTAAAIVIVIAVRPALAPQEPGTRMQPVSIAASDTVPVFSSGQSAPPDALGYLFPDAPALARFADRYAATTVAPNAGDGAPSAQDIAETGDDR